jgi:hypothetical protein
VSFSQQWGAPQLPEHAEALRLRLSNTSKINSPCSSIVNRAQARLPWAEGLTIVEQSIFDFRGF